MQDPPAPAFRQPVPEQHRYRRQALLGMVAVVIVWASLVPVAHELLRTMDALLIGGGRIALAGVILGTVTILVERRADVWRGVPWARTVLLGALGVGGFSVCVVFGVLYSGPISASAILAAGPVVAVLVVWLFDGRRPERRLYGPIVLAVLGAFLVALGNPQAATNAAAAHGGEALLLLGMALWSWYSVRAQAWLAHLGIGQLRLTFLTSLVAGVTLMLAWAVVHDWVPQPAAPFDGTSLALLVWLAVGPSSIGVALWNFGASRLGVTEATLIINLVPVLGVLISMAMGVEASWLQLLGGAVALGGVLWLQTRSAG
ncbi:DMT family transporter [Zavarzinia sp. CC-PAN008]|uniref:DMT family transporter n=1 Tax=Zavarzinia sp. CC-PAN008 TaxID=3243332 RepID=UPI003F744018